MVKIYALSDPITNDIRYIGKTIKTLDERLKNHLNKIDNTHVRCWIKKLKKELLTPNILLIDEVPDNEWQFWEIFYISLFKTWEFKLTNHTKGGDGCRIGKMSNDTKRKISLIRQKQGAPWMNNRFISVETKTKTSKTLIGRKLPKDRINKTAKAHEKKLKQYDFYGNLIKIFDSANDGSKIVNCHLNCIQMCATGKCRSAGGFIWRYINDDFNKYPTKVCQKLMKPVLQLDLNGVFIKEWESASKPEKELNFFKASIIRCCNNKQEKAYGFKWKYKEESI